MKDFASLTAALEKVVASGKKGITFSAVGTEEGTFQFLPWFWGAGADLRQLDSDKSTAALHAVDRLGEERARAQLRPAEHAGHQLGRVQDRRLRLRRERLVVPGRRRRRNGWGVIQIPGIDGGAAPAPTGGEFISIPVQKDTSRYATSAKIVECLTDGSAGATALGYVAPTSAGAQAQAAANTAGANAFWVKAVADAKPRTADNLGTDYPIISEQLYTAVQNALSGAMSPADALKAAQVAADAKLK